MHAKSRLFIAGLLFCLASPAVALALDWKTDLAQALKNGGAFAQNEADEVLFEYRGNDFFIPASTVKVATSAMAIKELGTEFRFPTDFYLTGKDELIVKGYGDPFLTSEEMKKIAGELKETGLKKISGIWLDVSYFAANLATKGAGQSLDPYNALNGALIANFNTVLIKKAPDGTITSAETQTPLTPIAMQRGKSMPTGTDRINLGVDHKIGAQYFGELLSALMVAEGIEIKGGIDFIKTYPAKTKKILTHKSSKTVGEIIAEILEYSTNFSSNQIYLALGAKKFGAPATHEKSQKVLQAFLQDELQWDPVYVYEGAGLSRMNKITPKQMSQLLKYFSDYKKLMPLKEKVFRAKTGTLNGVNTLAGYFKMPDSEKWIRFVVFVNEQVARNYRYDLAKKLYEGIVGKPPE